MINFAAAYVEMYQSRKRCILYIIEPKSDSLVKRLEIGPEQKFTFYVLFLAKRSEKAFVNWEIDGVDKIRPYNSKLLNLLSFKPIRHGGAIIIFFH